MELEFDINVDRENIGFLTAGIVLGVVFAAVFSFLGSGGDTASQSLVGFLENQSGQDLEVVSTDKAGQFYRVNVRDQSNQLNTYYTDGEMYSANMQNMEEVQNQINALTEFQTCLRESGTVMFGNASQQATQAQIQALGGTQVVAPIYQDISNNQTLAQAAQIGIQQVPAFYQNQSAVQGTQTLEQVEEFTGCTLEN